MTPAQIRELKPGQWITWTRSIWATPIDGKITEIWRADHSLDFFIEWDDNITTIESAEKLGRSSFQPREESH
jgi:hypothetical protein